MTAPTEDATRVEPDTDATAEPSTPEPIASTEIERASDISRGSLVSTSIDARIRYARELATADLLPRAFRGNPGSVLYAVEFGNMLGIHPLAAITGVHVMDGKPTASAALMGALVRKAGHTLRVRVTGTVENGDIAATATLIRSDDPDNPFVCTWTIDDAIRAELVDAYAADADTGKYVVRARTAKGNASIWQKQPRSMLKARAISEVCREGCEEILCGVHYTPEELGAQVDEDGHIIVETTLADTPEPSETPAERIARLAGLLREKILAATSIEELTGIYRQTVALPEAAALGNSQVADANGEAVTIGVLFTRHGHKLKGDGGSGGAQTPEEPTGPPDTPPAAQEAASGEQAATVDPYQEPLTPADLGLGDDAAAEAMRRAVDERGQAILDALDEAQAAAWRRYGRREPYVGAGSYGATVSAQLDDEHLIELDADKPADVAEGLRASVLAWHVQADLDEHVDAEPVPQAKIAAARPRAAMTRARLGIE